VRRRIGVPVHPSARQAIKVRLGTKPSNLLHVDRVVDGLLGVCAPKAQPGPWESILKSQLCLKSTVGFPKKEPVWVGQRRLARMSLCIIQKLVQKQQPPPLCGNCKGDSWTKRMDG
jgi:hypothetical protein